MADHLRIVEEIIAQHQLVKHDIGAMGGPLNDIEALFNLQRAHSAWSQGALNTLAARENELEQVILRVTAGLRTHFGFEEKWLPPLLGEVLMKGLVLQHDAIRDVLEKARGQATEGGPAAAEQEALLGRRARMQQAVSDICQSVEQHIANEEVLLKMLKQALTA